MKNLKAIFFNIACVVIGASAGYLLGIRKEREGRSHPTSEQRGQTAVLQNRLTTTADVKQGGRPITSARASNSNDGPSEAHLYLPISVLGYSPENFLSKDGIPSKLTLHKFGLSEAEATVVKETFEKERTKLLDTEKSHSKLIEGSSGEYFTIAAFPEQGREIKEALDGVISTVFSRFSDDRGAYFKRLVERSAFYDDLGTLPKQVYYGQGHPKAPPLLVVEYLTSGKVGEKVPSAIVSPRQTELLKPRYQQLFDSVQTKK
jgi:hypothetical protein